MEQKKMILLSGSGDTVAWFRLEFLNEFILRSYKVYVLAPGIRDDLKPQLEEMGVEFIEIKLDRKGFDVLNLALSVIELRKLFKDIQPDIIFSYTHKAILSGALAAKMSGFSNIFSLITGTGHIFDGRTLKERFIRNIGSLALKLALKFNKLVFFQNIDDKNLFLKNNIAKPQQARLVNGSGVNLDNFTKLKEKGVAPIICFAGRLIKEKGVYEFISAARLLRQKNINARFLLAGSLDNKNPSSLSQKDLDRIKNEGYVEVLGYQKDIPALYEKSHIVCLPSYREGFPKALIEAAAAGRAVVTTDVPGCRDAVVPNKTGLIVPVKNTEKLAWAIQWLIEHSKERVAMGKAGRELAVKEFSIEKIIKEHLKIYRELSKKKDNY